MVYQTSIDEKSPRAPEPIARGVSANMAELLSAIVTLFDLQWRLLLADLRQACSTRWRLSILFACGAALAISCAPIAIVIVAVFLMDVAHFGRLAALCWAFAFAMTASVSLIGAAVYWNRNAPPILRTSSEEWAANVQWINSMLARWGGGPGKSDRQPTIQTTDRFKED